MEWRKLTKIGLKTTISCNCDTFDIPGCKVAAIPLKSNVSFIFDGHKTCLVLSTKEFVSIWIRIL